MNLLFVNLLMMTLATSTAFAASPALNADGHLNATYAARSAVRLFEPKEGCPTGKDTEYSDEEGACYYYSNGNTISIEKNAVSISVVYGPANERGFEGRITNIQGNIIEAREVEEVPGDEDRYERTPEVKFVEDGCVMRIYLNANGTATSIAGETCDGRLSVDEAIRQ